jgi:CHAD domain-containing protein
MVIATNTPVDIASTVRGDPVVALGLELGAFAREQLLQAEQFLDREGDTRHGGIHQARKCIRRVRAVLALGRRALDHRAKRLDEDLGRLCRGLSRLRDAQALLEALSRLESNAPSTVIAVLPDAVSLARQRRDRMLDSELARDPRFAARRLRLLAFRQRLQRLNWQDLDETAVTRALRRSERRAEKAGRESFRHPDRDEDWHVYRRRLRHLRQQDSLLATVRPSLRPAIQGLEERATLLGEAQDDALLIRNCRRHSPFPAAPRALLRQLARDRLTIARRLP